MTHTSKKIMFDRLEQAAFASEIPSISNTTVVKMLDRALAVAPKQYEDAVLAIEKPWVRLVDAEWDAWTKGEGLEPS